MNQKVAKKIQNLNNLKKKIIIKVMMSIKMLQKIIKKILLKKRKKRSTEIMLIKIQISKQDKKLMKKMKIKYQ